jgi:hypothetical protein
MAAPLLHSAVGQGDFGDMNDMDIDMDLDLTIDPEIDTMENDAQNMVSLRTLNSERFRGRRG